MATKKSSSTSSNFGAWGWSMIIYAALSYYIASALKADLLNYYPAQFEALHGWNSGVITSMAGLAGWVGIIGAILWPYVIAKLGTRTSAGVFNIVTGALVILFANIQSFAGFIVLIFLINLIVGSVQVNLIPNNIMNVWFPKKKGIALGWATMGMPLCSATILLICTWLQKVTGSVSGVFTVFGIFVIVYGIVSFFWVKNSPESVGCYPDNEVLSAEEFEAGKKKLENHVSTWTIGKLLKNGNVWGIGVGLGLLWMTTAGIICQLVPRLNTVAGGAYASMSVSMMTIASVLGLFGSYMWGWLDQKIGTKPACFVYGFWYVVALILMILQSVSVVFVWLSVIMVGIGIGGIGNLVPSLVGTCFGRYDFIQANKVIAPLNTIVSSSGIILAGIFSQTSWGYTGLYGVLIVTSLIGVLLIKLLVKPECSNH